MANLDTQEQDENNLSQFKQIKQQAAGIVSQATSFQGTFTSLRADVSAENQAILDAKRTAFISQLQAALGI
jgi:hypothetical protein